MLKEKRILKEAEKEIEKEMNKKGYIDDSDNTDRFLDELIENLSNEDEELKKFLLEKIEEIMYKKYNKIGSMNERGDYAGCWYKDKKHAVLWAGFWQENSIFEAYEEFIEAFGEYIDITLEEFAEAYEVNLEDFAD